MSIWGQSYNSHFLGSFLLIATILHDDNGILERFIIRHEQLVMMTLSAANCMKVVATVCRDLRILATNVGLFNVRPLGVDTPFVVSFTMQS